MDNQEGAHKHTHNSAFGRKVGWGVTPRQNVTPRLKGSVPLLIKEKQIQNLAHVTTK